MKAAVVIGAGSTFIAGADIKEAFVGATPVTMLQQDLVAKWDVIRRVKTPITAAVSGFALGGGCELAMICDIIVASETAKFGQPEINLGIIPGAGGTQRWPRTAGKHVAMEAMLMGTPITAHRAYELGLVNKVVPTEMTIEIAQRYARQLAEKPPLAVRMAKEAVLRAFDSPLSEGLAAERKSFYFLFATEDQKEGMHAFLEKRKGVFKGR